jgi:hypothetical protein
MGLRQPFCGNLNRRAVVALVFAWRRLSPVAERCSIRLKGLDLERVARRNIARMSRAAVPTGTGRQSSKQIDLREKLDEVAGTDRTCIDGLRLRASNGRARSSDPLPALPFETVRSAEPLGLPVHSFEDRWRSSKISP